MVARYERQIGEQNMPNAYLRNHVTPDAAGAGVAAAIGGLGNAVGNIALRVQAYNDRQDEIDAQAALNDYNARMNDYLNNPETGQLVTRKLGDAKGVLQDTDDYATTTAQEISGKLSKGAAARFGLQEGRVRTSFTNTSAKYEAGQRQAYGDAQFKATLTGGLDLARANPTDYGTLDTAIDTGVLAIGEQMQGAPEEAVLQAQKAYASQVEASAIATVAQQDPVLANAMIQGAQYLTADDKASLEKAVKPEVERIKVQEFVDGFITDYPPEREAEGIAAIRKRYEGEEEERRVSAYKMRCNELAVGSAAKKESMTAQRKQITEQWYAEFTAQGQIIPRAAALELQARGLLESSDVDKIDRWNESVSNVAKIKSRLLSENPDWSPEELHRGVQRELGITPEEGRAVFLNTRVRVMEGTATKSDIDYFEQQGWLSPSEAEQLKDLQSSFGKEQQKFFADQRDGLIKSLDTLTHKKVPPEFKRAVVADFADRIKDLKPSAPNYREQVMLAKQTAIIDAADSYTGKTSHISKLVDAYQQLGYNEILDNGAYNSAMGLQPTNKPYAPGGPVATSGDAFMPGAGSRMPKGGAFSDRREYRNGQHNGVDYAAPEGTPIVVPNIGVPMTVTQVGSGSKTAGNFAWFEGALPDGRKIEMRISHMQDGSVPVKKGDPLTAGSLIGRVGSTGVSTGPHMDLKIKINGKYVDPDKMLPALVNAQTTPKATVAEDLGTLAPEKRKANVDTRQAKIDEAARQKEAARARKETMQREREHGPVR